MSEYATMREELRAMHPGMAKRADQGKKADAIRLFCGECMGGVRASTRCEERHCPLWPCVRQRVKYWAEVDTGVRK